MQYDKRRWLGLAGGLALGIGVRAGSALADGEAPDAPVDAPPVDAAPLAPAEAAAPADSSDAAAGDTAAQPAGAPPAMSDLELLILALVNGARTARGIAALQWDATMADVARAHAREMMSRGVVSHTGADGSSPNDRLRRAGVKFQFGSENIWTYWGGVRAEGPATMHAAMMAEPFAPGLWNHVGNILYGGYSRIGVGIAVAPSGVQYLSEMFADG